MVSYPSFSYPLFWTFETHVRRRRFKYIEAKVGGKKPDFDTIEFFLTFIAETACNYSNHN